MNANEEVIKINLLNCLLCCAERSERELFAMMGRFSVVNAFVYFYRTSFAMSSYQKCTQCLLGVILLLYILQLHKLRCVSW